MARLTYLTRYSGHADLARAMGLTSYTHFNSGGNARGVIVASNAKMAIIAVEGLNLGRSGKDRDRSFWNSELATAKEVCPNKNAKRNCKVIKSFRNLARKHWEKLPGKLGGVGKSKPIFVVGHSFGGWAAIYLAARLHDAGYNVKAVYTFGTPRFGNEKAKQAINDRGLKIFRFIVKDDYAADWPNQNAKWPNAQIVYLRKNDVNTNKKKQNVKEGGFDIFKSNNHESRRYLNRVYKFAKKDVKPWNLPEKGEFW